MSKKHIETNFRTLYFLASSCGASVMQSISPAQLRGARAMLGWDLREAARRSGVGFTTIGRLEKQTGTLIEARTSTVALLIGAYETASIAFFGNGIEMK
jgi:predicted transcriptional regulator